MIKIQYSLNLPQGVNAEGDKPTSSTKSHQFKIDAAASSNTYYDALRNALEKARRQVGDELTVWKECEVGGGKELMKGNGDGEEEEEEEEWYVDWKFFPFFLMGPIETTRNLGFLSKDDRLVEVKNKYGENSWGSGI